MPPVEITIAYTDGCEHTPPTRVLVEQVAAEIGLPIRLETVRVTTVDQARRYRLHGSPTVLVEGLDIDPAMRERTDYGFA
jgi:hypothetical protein